MTEACAGEVVDGEDDEKGSQPPLVETDSEGENASGDEKCEDLDEDD